MKSRRSRAHSVSIEMNEKWLSALAEKGVEFRKVASLRRNSVGNDLLSLSCEISDDNFISCDFRVSGASTKTSRMSIELNILELSTTTMKPVQAHVNDDDRKNLFLSTSIPPTPTLITPEKLMIENF